MLFFQGQPATFESFVKEHSKCLLDSYRHYLGRDLIQRTGDLLRDAEALYSASFVVLSSNAEASPNLNYGNLAAQDLWGANWEEFTSLLGQETAEPELRSVRAKLLQRVREEGYISDYSGVRISKSMQRFRINRAVVWNLLDSQGNYVGQAATFSDWERLPEKI